MQALRVQFVVYVCIVLFLPSRATSRPEAHSLRVCQPEPELELERELELNLSAHASCPQTRVRTRAEARARAGGRHMVAWRAALRDDDRRCAVVS